MGREGEEGRREGVKEGWGGRGGKGRKGREGEKEEEGRRKGREGEKRNEWRNVVYTIFTSSKPHSLSTSVPPIPILLILPIPILEYEIGQYRYYCVSMYP